MSVLACDRVGCDNVMCDHLSDRYGYLCWPCLIELKASPNISIQHFMRGEDYKEDQDHLAWSIAIDEVFIIREEYRV